MLVSCELSCDVHLFPWRRIPFISICVDTPRVLVYSFVYIYIYFMRGTPRAYFTSCVVRPSRVFYLKEVWFNKLPFIQVWWNTNFNLHPYTYMYISKNCMRPNTFTYVYIHIQFYETLFAPRCRWKYTCIQDINVHILTHIHIH